MTEPGRAVQLLPRPNPEGTADGSGGGESKGAILIVDDDRNHAEGTADVLEGAGYSCDIAVGGKQGLDALRRRQYDLVLTDLVMADADGLAILRHAQEINPFVAVIVFTGSLGLLRLPTFFERVHAPTMGTTLGTACILVGSMIQFGLLESRPVMHEILIAAFMTFSTPVTYMLLGRAALQREHGD